MKKFTEVNAGNIHLICYRIKQFIQRHGCVSDTAYYNSRVRCMDQYLPKGFRYTNGFSIPHLTESNASYFLADKARIEVDTMFGKTFIRVSASPDCALVIYCGDKIRITPNDVYMRLPGMTIGLMGKTPYKYLSRMTPANANIGKRHYDNEVAYSTQYWADYEEELKERETREELEEEGYLLKEPPINC